MKFKPHQIILGLSVLVALLALLLVSAKPEGYAFNTGTSDKLADVDLTKWYYVGSRNTSNTLEAARNGGKECTEYAETAYKIAPAVDAKCQGDVQDAYYTFDPTTKLGLYISPFYIRSPNSGMCWHPEGGSETPADGTRVVQFDAECGTRKTLFTMDDSGSIKHINGLCLGAYGAGTTNGDRLGLSGGFCNQKWEFLPGNILRHKNSGRYIHPEGGSGRRGYPLVTWNDSNPAVTTYVPTK